MKANKMLIIAILAIVSMMTVSCCGNCNKNSKECKTATKSADTVEVMTIDSLLASAEKLVDKTVVFEGVCTHACSHGATKIFMMGSDNSKTIRVQAGEFGAFDTKCIRSVVRINGIVREERIDEGYLKAWEERAAKIEAEGSNEEVSCSSEKIARGEKGTTEAERIAAFREQIAQRKAAEGKEYLSFYYVDAVDYEIK